MFGMNLLDEVIFGINLLDIIVSFLILCAILLFIRFIYSNKKLTNLLLIAIMLISAYVFSAAANNESKHNELAEQIASKLGTKTDSIIIENISETDDFFSNPSTENLNKVYYNGTTYLAETEGANLKKLIEYK